MKAVTNFDIAIVQPDSITGRREFVQTSPRSGECYLSCHGSAHSPKTYPAAQPAARRLLR